MYILSQSNILDFSTGCIPIFSLSTTGDLCTSICKSKNAIQTSENNVNNLVSMFDSNTIANLPEMWASKTCLPERRFTAGPYSH